MNVAHVLFQMNTYTEITFKSKQKSITCRTITHANDKVKNPKKMASGGNMDLLHFGSRADMRSLVRLSIRMTSN